MRAALCESYGGPDVVKVVDVDPPSLTPDTVRVRIGAAAINFPDVLIVANTYQISAPLPFVPGSEFAGDVVEVGADVDGLTVGERVFGTLLVGAFAEEVVAPSSALTRVPDTVSLESAAAFGVAYRTAYHSLRTVAEIHPSDELVVLGAGGGVGLAAVQIGTVFGATVTAVASSPDKLAAAQAAGAQRLVNYKDSDLRAQLREQLPAGANVVLDPVGGDLSEPALRSLGPGGRFVTVGFASGAIPRIPLNLVLLKDIEVRGFEFRSFMTRHPDTARRDETELMELFTTGRVTPQVHATFGLADVAAALQHVATGKAVGKVVIRVGSR